MSQVEPVAAWRSTCELKKTPKQKQIDEDKASKDNQIVERATEKESQREAKQHRVKERERIAQLQSQAKEELDNADATVQMMYDMGEVPGLDSNHPEYELIQKIAQRTGENYAGQDLTAEELQEILDDPDANTTLGASNESTKNGPPVGQPDFALYYPGVTFSGNLDANPSSTPTATASKHARPDSTDTPTAKKHCTLTGSASPRTATGSGSLVPPSATSRYDPGHLQPLPSPANPTNADPNPNSIPNPASGSRTTNNPPPAATLSALPLNTRYQDDEHSEGDYLPSHPISPASSVPASPKTGVPLSKEASPAGRACIPPLAKGKGRAQSPSTVPSQTTAASNNPAPDLNQLISERNAVANEVRSGMAIWQSRFHEVVQNEPLPPDLDALAKRIGKLRERYHTLDWQSDNVRDGDRDRPEDGPRDGDEDKDQDRDQDRDLEEDIQGDAAGEEDGDAGGDGDRNHNRDSDSDQGGYAYGGGDGDVSEDGNLNDEDDLGNDQGPDDHSKNDQNIVWGQVPRSEKEQQNKPKLSDFSPADSRILLAAKPYALACLLAQGIFKYHETDAGPKLERKEIVYRQAWTLACQDLGVERPYCPIFGKWLGQRRSAFINRSAKLLRPVVDQYLGFTPNNPRRNIAISKAASGRGCHKEEKGRAFQSPLLHKGIYALVFDPEHPYGVLCPQLFRRISSRLIAYVCAMLQYIINGYRKGPWNGDRLSAPTQGAFFRQYLKDYEKEENSSPKTKAWGKAYRKKIYAHGLPLYEAGRPIEEPMAEAEGTWLSDMEFDFA